MTKSEQMARVRSSDTQPELVLRRSLWRAGLRYRVRPRLPGTPDIVFLGPHVAAFVDGCFWHGCPLHYRGPVRNAAFWAQKLQRNRERDKKATNALERAGWLVLRIWEHEIHSDLPAVTKRVEDAIASRAIRRGWTS